MGTVSAIPENLFAYSDACTRGAEELQRWVSAVLTPALREYAKSPGAVTCSVLDTDVARQVAAAYYSDRHVRTVGQAFLETQHGGGLTARDPRTPVSAPEQAVDAAVQQLEQAAAHQPGTPSPPPGSPLGLSYELYDAWFLQLPYVDPEGSRYSPAQDAVLSWVELHRDVIIREAAKRNIDPRAIVAAIAWEALVNVEIAHDPFPPGVPYLGRRSDGPGKVHVDSIIVKQIEDHGYLPHLSLKERESALGTADGSIEYIAAIMGAYADLTEKEGHPPIRDNVSMLTQLYQGSDLDQWERYLRRHPSKGTPIDPYVPGNPMAIWAMNQQQFLDDSLRPQKAGDPPWPRGLPWRFPGLWQPPKGVWPWG